VSAVSSSSYSPPRACFDCKAGGESSIKQLTNDRKTILIPAAVFVEFLNVLGRKVGHEVALAAASELTPPFLVLSEPANLPQSPALKKFANIPEAVSFTDCIVMAVADEYGTSDIFGFDKQFQDAGYHRLEPATK
jgi:predicted nucleic acid-binding protein